MASLKLQLVLVIVGLVAAVSATDLLVGRRINGDSLACYGTVHLAAQPGRIVSATRICNVPNQNQYITQVSAKDTGAVGRGGYAQITAGGIGYKTVTLYLWSQPSQPLDFDLNIYAY